jgi:hypothetical protein
MEGGNQEGKYIYRRVLRIKLHDNGITLVSEFKFKTHFEMISYHSKCTKKVQIGIHKTKLEEQSYT